MRFKLFSIITVLLFVGSNDARPSKIASPEVAVEEASTGGKDDVSSWRPIEQRSSSVVQSDSRLKPPSPQRELKDLHHMDQSLRTVATQLLNVSNPEESVDGKDDPKIANGELAPSVLLIRKKDNNANPASNNNQQNVKVNTKSDMELVKEINSEISSLESMGAGFGRPSNSKFGYFEASHPGQAMAMTEEELERELMTSTTRLMTAHKNRPTTTGGISTWILLNPPTTTSKTVLDHSNDNGDKEVNVKVQLQTKLTTPEQIFETTLKTDVQTNAEKTLPESTTPMEKIKTLTKVTTPVVKKTTVTVRQPTTEKPAESTQMATKTEKIKTVQTATTSQTTRRDPTTTPKSISASKKPGNSSRPTPKLKVTTPKSTNVTSKPMSTKFSRPSQSTKPKPSPTRKATPKPVAEKKKNANTPKIEKVTFRPVQMITTPKSLVESVERPTFVTKLKTSFATDSNLKPTLLQPMEPTISKNDEITTKGEISNSDLVEISVKAKPQMSSATKTNNVLKVQLKKPAEAPKIEIESIEVNEPVLRIQKIEESNTVSQKETTKPADSTILDNSRIDLKFDFNPELTKIDVSTSTQAAPRSSTTKRPHKRKKNKLRRRKPTTSAPSTTIGTSATKSESTSAETIAETLALTTLTPTTPATSTEIEENLSEVGIADSSLQESKIIPESKVSPSKTKNKKKNQQLQKPIGTQIYNFLSREVMPSFGMMSLVGLGLGLASYFLYPFGGVAARRNYVVEPNYKYNLDEYGGNYGQNEEEVFSKVLQGMTNNDGKYGGIKDYENNFYRYQHYDGAYTDSTATTRKGDPRYPTPSVTNYRPLETTVYDTKYRNTEFKYPDLTTTPNYYDRRKPTAFLTKKPVNGDSRFVVGNVPKDYGYEDRSNIPTTVAGQTNFEREITQSNKFSGKNPGDISSSYAHAEALKSNDDYEEIVITPAAVAVEHGPRSLQSDDSPRSRRKRESVIQLIPSRTEIKKEEEEIEKEEPLSNEILDIIDSVIPGETATVGKDTNKMHKGKDGEDKKQGEDKKHDVEKKAAEGDTSKKVESSSKKTETVEATTQSVVTGTAKAVVVTSSTSTPTSTTAAAPTTSTSTVKSLTIDEILGSTAFPGSKDPEDSSAEWLDHTTTEKPHEGQPFGLFNIVKKIAEVKFKLGLAILKHASEGFARYLGHVQKRVNGEE